MTRMTPEEARAHALAMELAADQAAVIRGARLLNPFANQSIFTLHCMRRGYLALAERLERERAGEGAA